MMEAAMVFIGSCLAPAVGIFVPAYGAVALLGYIFARDKDLTYFRGVMLFICLVLLLIYSGSKVDALIETIKESGFSLQVIIGIIVCVPFLITLFYMLKDLIRKDREKNKS